MQNNKLYLESGYLNIEYLASKGDKFPFVMVVGGRGTGKTYGALKHAKESNKRFILLRRTMAIVENLATQEFNPFKSLNSDMGWNIYPFRTNKHVFTFYETETDENGKLIPVGDSLGIMTALSTFYNLRGFDASDKDIMIYDEFIPEVTERTLKDEATALFNTYETCNRNRELQGKRPIQLFLLSNSNTIKSDIISSLSLTQAIIRMKRNAEEIKFFPAKRLALIVMSESPISKQKASTALYTLTGDSKFSRMSLENEFAYNEFNEARKINIKEYRPIIKLGDELSIYKHKSKPYFYATTHHSGSPTLYKNTENDKILFRIEHKYLYDRYINGQIFFQDESCEIMLTKFLLP